MGERGIAWVAGQRGFGALGITSDDRVVWSPLIEELLAAPERESGRGLRTSRPPGTLLTVVSGWGVHS